MRHANKLSSHKFIGNVNTCFWKINPYKSQHTMPMFPRNYSVYLKNQLKYVPNRTN